MDKDTLFWVSWLVAFLIIEIPAAFTKRKGDTLSENVWRWYSIRDERRFARVRRMILAGFLAALFFHLVFAWSVVPVIVFGIGMVAVIVGSVLWERQ